jgi:hypothetical protein
MGRSILLLALTLTSIISLDCQAEKTVFKSKDDNGNTVYSDQASETAEEIKVDAPQTFKAQPTSGLFKPSKAKKELETSLSYTILRIVSPEHDTAVRNNAGNITVRFEVAPPIQVNHTLQLMIDGTVKAEQKSTAPISVSNVDRGTHKIQARIIEDESGEVLQTSNSVSTTILRVSILQRSNS